MDNQNLSDIIEAYLKEVLNQKEQVDIRRNEIAEQFKCVPSQINYVINTRFTIQRGYSVESKRGGGGYIRIEKVQISSYYQFLREMNQMFDDTLTEAEARGMLQKLFEEELLTKREADLLYSTTSKVTLGRFSQELAIRAAILHEILERLSYQEKE